MNEHNLKLLCEMEGLYEFPEMNNKLYLHFKVIEHICGLEKYVNWINDETSMALLS